MIQWYPGHMAKAIREIKEKVKLVDLVIIILDARIPLSSYNPEFKTIFNNKKILYLLNKKDKADDKITSFWISYYNSDNNKAIAIDARDNKTKKMVEKASLEIMHDKLLKDEQKGLKKRPIRTMIVGIPNVGKSTLINTLCSKKVAATGDKPGVTKSQQWTRINDNLELLDTPGVLWPKFENQIMALNLAICGSIKDDILPLTDVAIYFLKFLKEYYPDNFMNRYNFENDGTMDTLCLLGKKLCYVKGNGDVDIDKVALNILQDFRNEKLGRLSLDQKVYEKI